MTFWESTKKSIENATDILQGRRVLYDSDKYRFLSYSLAAIHAIICLRFFLLDYTILYIFNFVSTIAYLYLGTVLAKQEKYLHIFLFSYCEVITHSVLASILAGWDWGFMIYILAIIPVAFYLSYSLPSLHHNMKLPFLFSYVAMCIFVVTIFLCDAIDPIYTARKYDVELTIAYAFNSLVAFIMLILFSIFFVIEIRRNEIKLESQFDALQSVSSIDPLTKLLNRRSMDVHLTDAMEIAKTKGHRFSLIIGDIDNFKKINDTYGHNVGDEILINVANTIVANAPVNAQVCRWGGEEILILVRITLDDAVPVAEKMREQIEKMVTYTEIDKEDIPIRITMTFGVAEYVPGFGIPKLVAIADDNLYRGKREGKNRVVV